MFGMGTSLSLRSRSGSLIATDGGIATIVLLSLLHVAVHIAFIALADAEILRALSETSGNTTKNITQEKEEEFEDGDEFVTANDEE